MLFDISQDENGTDLATARVPLQRHLSLVLDNSPLPKGSDVSTYGYPLTDHQLIQNGHIDFLLNPRYLQGYITRVFCFSHSEFGEVLSYEFDMPPPAGLSGAPLIKLRTHQVVGVVYGSNDVGSIDHFASVNPETGYVEPEVQRIVSFGLAHHTEVIWSLRGVATEHQPLIEYLEGLKRARPARPIKRRIKPRGRLAALAENINGNHKEIDHGPEGDS